MASGDGNFPVPRIRRDRKVLPAMTNGWLADDIPNNLRKNAALSRRDAGRSGGNFFATKNRLFVAAVLGQEFCHVL
jgi:hypothetical protein